jgi:hypothetical protein
VISVGLTASEARKAPEAKAKKSKSQIPDKCSAPHDSARNLVASFFHTTMAVNTPKKQSRVLAALGSNPPLFNVPQRSEPLHAFKRKGTPNYELPAESSAKKRAGPSQLGVGINPVENEGKQG